MVKLKRFVLVILFIFVSLSLFAFKIESTAKPIAEIFYQFDDKENLPKIKSDSYDRFIEILVYKLDINDLIGASYLSDLKITKSNLIGEYKYESNPDSRIKLSEIPTIPEFGLLYFEINSDRMSEKFFLNIKKTETVVMLSEEGIKLRLWNILDGRIIDKVKCIRLEDGVNIGSSSKGVVEINNIPENDKTILIYSEEGSLLWKPQIEENSIPSREMAVVITDRPAYKAGDTVNFRVFLRKIEPDGYSIVNVEDVKVEILDPLYRVVEEFDLKPDEYSSVNGEFKTNSFITRGSYRIRVIWNEQDYYHYFQIADYKKPTFKTEATPQEKVFKVDETIKIDMESSYFFGEPVSFGSVSYILYKEGMYVDSGSGILDNDGKAVLGYGKELEPGYYDMVINVSDETGMETSNSVFFKVIKGNYEFQCDVEWIEDEIFLNIETLDIDGTPVSEPFKVKVWYEESIKVENNEYKDVKFVIYNESAVTDKEGTTRINMDISSVPKDQYIFVELTGNNGENLKKSLYLSKYTPSNDYFRIDDISYAKPGELTTIKVFSPYDIDLWIIADFSGVIHSAKLEILKGNNFIEVPVPENYSFGRYTIYLKGYKKDDKVDEEMSAYLDLENKNYQLTFTGDKNFKPGEAGKIFVNVKDANGSPVETNLTISILSQALKELYEGKEYDSWESAIEEPFYYGFNTVTFPSINYNPYPSIANLITLEQLSMPAAESKVARTTADYAYAKEAGAAPEEALGEDEGTSGTGEIAAREDFNDSVLWNITTFTNETGDAEISFVMPDDLDQWLVRALVSDGAGNFGYGKEYLQTKKNVTVTSYLPEFYVSDDNTVFSFVIRNNSDEASNFECKFGMNGEKTDSQIVRINANSSRIMKYEYSIKEVNPETKSEEIEISFEVNSDVGTDAVLYKIPVYSSYTYLKEGYFDITDNDLNITFDELSLVNLTTGTNLNPITLQGIRYLLDYPYGCTEQTTSKLIPLYIYYDLIIENELLSKEELDERISDGLERIYGFQRYDGKWGWWKDSSADKFMTSYAMFGLYLAKEYGFEVNEGVLKSGYDGLKNFYNYNSDPFVQYVYILFSKMYGNEVNNGKAYAGDPASLALTSLAAYELGSMSQAVEYFDKIWDEIDFDDEDTLIFNTFDYFFDETVTFAFIARAANMVEQYNTEKNTVMEILKMNQGGYWGSTASTAIALTQLDKFSSIFDEDTKITIESNAYTGENINPNMSLNLIFKPGETLKIETDEPIYVSISKEIPKTFSDIENTSVSDENIGLLRILRRIERIPRDGVFVRTMPQIDSPYIVKDVEKLDFNELETLEIILDKTYKGHELSLESRELKLGDYYLGINFNEASIMGKFEGGVLIRAKEYDYYGNKEVFYKITFKENSVLKVGDIIISEMRLNSPDFLRYVVMEDYKPSCSVNIQGNDDLFYDNYYKFNSDYSYDTYYSFKEELYDKNSYFFDWEGNYLVRSAYQLIASGEYIVPPAHAWGMYDDYINGTTEQLKIKVYEK